MPDSLNVAPEETEEAIETMAGFLKNLNLRHVLTIVLLLAACMVVMKLLLRLLDRTFQRLDVEKNLYTFLRAVLRVLLWLLTLCLVLGYMGIEMTSLIALLSVLGLAVSLAIQGALSNLAGGIQLLISKPFQADDYIDAGAVSGTVVEVGLVYTRLRTVDNKTISIPNGTISGETIVNYSAMEQRRVEIVVTASYDAPPEQVAACLRQVAASHPKVLPEPEPFARLSGYQDSSVAYTVRVWCATEDYWEVYFDLLEQIGTAFRREGIEMSYPHLNVHMVEEKGGTE